MPGYCDGDNFCRTALSRLRLVSFPRIAMVWKRGGVAVRPVTDVLSKPKNFPVLKLRPALSWRKVLSRD